MPSNFSAQTILDLLPYLVLSLTVAAVAGVAQALRAVPVAAAVVGPSAPTSAPGAQGLAEGAKSAGSKSRLGAFAWIIVGVILITFSAMRYGIGTDYALYSILYGRVDPGSLGDSIATSPQEVGFVALMFVARQFSEQPYLAFAMAAALTVIPTLLAIRRSSVDPAYSIFLYIFFCYYTTSFNAMRQSIAVAFLLLADTYRHDRKIVWILLSALAVTFHTSAIIAIVAQFGLAFWRPRAVTTIMVIGLGVPLGIAFLTSPASSSIMASLSDRYEGYLQAEAAGIGTVLVLAVRIILIALSLSMPRDKQDSRHLAYVTASVVVLGVGSATWVIGRLEPYFGVFLIILIANQLARSRTGSTWRWLIGIGAVVYFCFHVSAYNGLLPYMTIRDAWS